MSSDKDPAHTDHEAVPDSYPYTLASRPLGEFLTKLKSVGVPAKIDKAYLDTLGYKSSNHRAFIPVLKFINLIDAHGVPTEKYRQGLRGGDDGRALVGQGIREGYKSLFDLYPDADVQPAASLSTFFSARTTFGDRALQAAVSTFQAVCKFGDFDGASADAANHADPPDGGNGSTSKQRGSEGAGGGGRGASMGGGSVTINVNIALSVDATSDAAVYDAFFAAMAKHLTGLADGGSTTNSS